VTAYTTERTQCFFPAGYNPRVTCKRLTLDPLRAMHRPLAWYGGVLLSQWAAGSLLRLGGFRLRRAGRVRYWWRPPPRALLPGRLPEPPWLFLHGVGVGLLPYLPLLHRGTKARGGLVVELPFVAQVTSASTSAPWYYSHLTLPPARPDPVRRARAVQRRARGRSGADGGGLRRGARVSGGPQLR
jgi:hypothetical protein